MSAGTRPTTIRPGNTGHDRDGTTILATDQPPAGEAEPARVTASTRPLLSSGQTLCSNELCSSEPCSSEPCSSEPRGDTPPSRSRASGRTTPVGNILRVVSFGSGSSRRLGSASAVCRHRRDQYRGHGRHGDRYSPRTSGMRQSRVPRPFGQSSYHLRSRQLPRPNGGPLFIRANRGGRLGDDPDFEPGHPHDRPDHGDYADDDRGGHHPTDHAYHRADHAYDPVTWHADHTIDGIHDGYDHEAHHDYRGQYDEDDELRGLDHRRGCCAPAGCLGHRRDLEGSLPPSRRAAWKQSGRPVLQQGLAAQSLLSDPSARDNPEGRASVDAQVERAASALGDLAARAPDEESELAARSSAAALRAVLFANEADRLLRERDQPPTADQLNQADQARRASSEQLDASLTELNNRVGPEPTPPRRHS